MRKFLIACCCLVIQSVQGQTDGDAIMLNKKVLCVGVMYSYGSWKDYWEGSFKRDNENMGTVSTQMLGVMGNYGISKNLNVLFSLPYVQTKATDGTLKGLRGFQDLALMLKWRALTTDIGSGKFSAFAIGGFSLPTSNYVADFLPMSIGLRSKNVSIRAMADYQVNKIFATASASYMVRSKIEIDRNAYYDTEMHYTNIVDMPNVAGGNFRAGYRSKKWIAEALIDHMQTLGGFDIRKNDMPFPSNKMIATAAGVNFKYTSQKIRGLEITGGARHTISGRNVGQTTMFNAGVFYLMDLSPAKTRKS